MGKSVKIFVVVILVIFLIALSLFYYVNYRIHSPVTPSMRDVQSLVHTSDIEKLDRAESNLLNSSQNQTSYFVKATGIEYVFIVDQYLGKKTEVKDTYMKIYKTTFLETQDEFSVQKLAIIREGINITGKNEVEVTVNGQSQHLILYKADNGNQVSWFSEDAEKYVITSPDHYEFYNPF